MSYGYEEDNEYGWTICEAYGNEVYVPCEKRFEGDLEFGICLKTSPALSWLQP
jgi:hypothetical protein